MNLYIIILASPTKPLQGAAPEKHTKYIKIFNNDSIFIFVFLKCCVLITLYFFRSFSFMTLHPVLLRLTCTSSFILAVRCVKAIADAKGNGTCGI